MSVLALVSRPTGPAAAAASPPIVNLSPSSLFIPLSFITSMIRSVEEPPSCSPKLPPSMATAAGALQPREQRRQDANPRPYLPPTPNAPLSKPGTITTHCALSISSCGMPLSRLAMMSLNAVAGFAGAYPESIPVQQEKLLQGTREKSTEWCIWSWP